MISIVIPSRNEQFLQKTIQDILSKATGDIEVIAVLEGYWPPVEEIIEDKRVVYINFGTPQGMRGAINAGVAIAKGEYILKCDAHVMFDKGFDEKLLKDIEYDWVVVPRRYALDPYNWQIENRSDDKYPIDYMKLEDFHGVVDNDRRNKRKDIMIDDLMSAQGSCWFMKKSYYNWLELLDEKTYTKFWNEFQEIGLKVWLSGGKVKVNKNTWYAHWHKTEGRGYSLTEDQQIALNNLKKWQVKGWHKQKKPLKWLYERFK